MNEVNFSVRISEARSKKINVFLARKGKGKTELVEHIIDNIEQLRPALDSTCANPKSKKK